MGARLWQMHAHNTHTHCSRHPNKETQGNIAYAKLKYFKFISEYHHALTLLVRFPTETYQTMT